MPTHPTASTPLAMSDVAGTSANVSAEPATPAPPTSEVSAPVVTLAVAPPPANSPSAPTGFTLRKKTKSEFRLRLQKAQVDAAAEAGYEIELSLTFVSDFGDKAPPAAVLGAAMSSAGAWSAEVARATLWLAYAKEQKDAAWQHALPMIGLFRPVYAAVVASAPTTESEYPKVTIFFAPAATRSAHAASARRANQAAGTNANEKRAQKAAEKAAEKAEAKAAVARGEPTKR